MSDEEESRSRVKGEILGSNKISTLTFDFHFFANKNFHL